MSRHLLSVKGQQLNGQIRRISVVRKRSSNVKCEAAIHAMEPLEARRLLSASAWLSGSSLPAGRGDAGALLSNTGGIYIFGGTVGTTASNTVLELDPNNNFAATSKTSMGSARTGFGVAQTGFYALLFGGASPTNPTGSATEYTVITNDGEGPVSVPSMSVPRSYFASATDTSGNVYAIGGISSSNHTVATAEVYNPVSNSWSAIAPLPVALSGASAASDGAGHIFVFGGKTAAGAPVSTVYRYTITTNAWDVRAAMPVSGLRFLRQHLCRRWKVGDGGGQQL
jgi:hypothetical protein